MGKLKASAPAGPESTGSRATGLFWKCNLNETHHEPPMAQCTCGANGRAALLPLDWTDEMGLTHEQARARGFLVLAVVRARRVAR